MTVVDCARRYVGYLEHKDPLLLEIPTANIGKGGYTIFAELIRRAYRFRNFQGLPWCAEFVHAVFLEALGKQNARKLLGKPHPGTRVLARRMDRKGLLRDKGYRPDPGNIIFLRNLPDEKISHVGIVVRTDGEKVISIEGNTIDPTGHFDKKQGGAVAVKIRQWDNPAIVCYGSVKE